MISFLTCSTLGRLAGSSSTDRELAALSPSQPLERGMGECALCERRDAKNICGSGGLARPQPLGLRGTSADSIRTAFERSAAGRLATPTVSPSASPRRDRSSRFVASCKLAVRQSTAFAAAAFDELVPRAIRPWRAGSEARYVPIRFQCRTSPRIIPRPFPARRRDRSRWQPQG